MRKLTIVSAALIAATSLGAGAQSNQSPVRPRTLAEDLQLFSQVLNQIRVNHVDSVDMHALLLSAIEGMVQAADPHSFVIPAVRLDSSRRKAWLDGKLDPVPIDFQFVAGAAIVASVVPGSRVAKLDVLIGDELIEIEGRPIHARSAEELSYTLAGLRGTSVRVKFERRRADGSIVAVERLLPRQRPEDQSAIAIATMVDSITGYVRIATFVNDKVASDLGNRLDELDRLGLKRLILDLRDNGGGRVDQAAEVAGAFLPRGTLVYSIKGTKESTTDTGRVKRAFWHSERRVPLIVLVNAGTASASELVAGALQDHDRALVVGHTTFGKALVMLPVPLSDGSLMVLSIGKVSTPCGRVVQREYRGLTTRHYLRTAGAVVDTAGRPSCKTDGGRVVYGGGGIVPDVELRRANRPVWLTQLAESDAFLSWSSGFVAANPAQFTTLDAFADMLRVPAGAEADFRKFAASRGVDVPTDSTSTSLLSRTLLRTLALAKWNDDGLHRIVALTDAEIREAVGHFPEAQSLPSPSRPPR